MTITPYEATLYNIFLAWETGQPVTCNWDTGEVWAGDKLLKRHCWQHNYYFMAGDNVLRDKTKGHEERIFTYEKGEQVWW